MKINFTYIFLAFILIFLIMVSISKSCVKISPYEGSYGNMYPYEAMTPMMNPMMTPMMARTPPTRGLAKTTTTTMTKIIKSSSREIGSGFSRDKYVRSN